MTNTSRRVVIVFKFFSPEVNGNYVTRKFLKMMFGSYTCPEYLQKYHLWQQIMKLDGDGVYTTKEAVSL